MPGHDPYRQDAAGAGARPEPPEMSGRAMLLLGGGTSLGVVAVLGLTLLVGGAGGAGGAREDAAASPVSRSRAEPPPNAAPAARVVVPQVAGLPSMTAVSRLTERRVPLGSVIRVPSSRPAGLVLRSYPEAGAALGAGGQVSLYVSAGLGGTVTGGRVVVPYFIGLTVPQARGAAAGLGLRVAVLSGTATVAAQDPAPGTVARRGATVTVRLR
ncbi:MULTISPECIES: PASTA domain-containing protein [Actinomadura]|uniref:PASTA domain-containing protein n=1 Tax=Actinomadura yumaensis TaxID=111807 RepID=A0ABW2CVJ3_9ACTN|nr:PASTA domain-containing protein [Actinomadura sp. J1-007]